MPDWQDIFQSRDMLQPGADFEERVFCKIRKKKRMRKIGYGVTAVGGLLLAFSLLQVFRPAVRPVVQSKSDAPISQKEEIPLREDLFFSAFDNHTRYSIEPVSLQKKPQDGDAAINQI